jgi:MscS family membrane protein
MEKFILAKATLFSEEFAQLLSSTAVIMPNWKWLVLIIGVVAILIVHPVIQLILHTIKKRYPLARRFPHGFVANLLRLPIEKSLTWVIVFLLLSALGDILAFEGKFETYYRHLLLALIAFHILKLLNAAVDAMTKVSLNLAAKTESTFDDQLIPFAAKSLKVIIVILGVLIVLQSFGLNVMSLLAGLGLGGLALALAAQDTAANLFGSITILFDSPFKVGDWVKVKDVEGTVEEIGFRSTRVRTFYNSLVTLPNSVVAKENIDNMGVRPARRIRQVLGLTYQTPPEKIQQFCIEARSLIEKNPKVNPSTVLVYFNNFNSSALDILVQYHLQVFTGTEELETQMEIFLEILRLAKNLGVDFAYPTQTVYQTHLTTT